MNLEQMKKIVDGAPGDATSVVVSKCGNYALYGRGNQSDNRIMLDALRTELAKHEPMELRAVDIPHGTIVLEK